jgi:hypothetical protein
MIEEPEFIGSVNVQAVKGCLARCRRCIDGELPQDLSPMPPETLRAAIKRRKSDMRTGAVATNFYYNIGDPLANPRLHELTQVIHEELPDSRVYAFWGMRLNDMNSAEDLVKRTKGLHSLTVSMDTHHYAAVRREMLEKLAPGTRLNRDVVHAEMQKRLLWASQAQQENGFKLVVRLTGRVSPLILPRQHLKEVDLYMKLASQTLPDNSYKTDEREDAPRGSGLGRERPFELIILHDGRDLDRMPQTLMPEHSREHQHAKEVGEAGRQRRG